MANVNRLLCNTGFKYEHDGQLCVRYSTKKGVKYLKCVDDSCPGRASIKNGIIYITGVFIVVLSTELKLCILTYASSECHYN